MELSEILNVHCIDLDVNLDTKEDVIDRLSTMLLTDNKISKKEEFIKDVYYRESIGPTGMGDGIAIPHGISEHVLEASVSIIRLNKPVKWESLDEEPVDLIFLLAIPKESRDKVQIRLLAQLASVLAHEEVVEELRKTKDKDIFFKVFSNNFNEIEK